MQIQVQNTQSRPSRPRELQKLRVLIVEDDGSVSSGLASGLAPEGYEVEQCADGESALGRLAASGFELVVLDIGLPGIDGYEVLRRLRLQGRAMPVLVLTARDAVDDRIRGLDLGADDYMTKPFSIPELAARVRALLRRGQVQTGARITHGPLEVDGAARRAFLDGAPLDLAAREWSVLQILIGKVEKVVSKESIIQSISPWQDELSENAIEVYVSRLRAKLDPAGIRIRTVRGFGYMLEEYREARAPVPGR